MVNIKVRLSDASTFEVAVELTATTLELKRLVRDKTAPPTEPENQKIVYKGRILKDEDTLASYGTTSQQVDCRLRGGKLSARGSGDGGRSNVLLLAVRRCGSPVCYLTAAHPSPAPMPLLSFALRAQAWRTGTQCTWCDHAAAVRPQHPRQLRLQLRPRRPLPLPVGLVVV
jgi:hypothetical protein